MLPRLVVQQAHALLEIWQAGARDYVFEVFGTRRQMNTDLAPEMDGKGHMAVKHGMPRQPVATVIRTQIIRQDFRNAVQSSQLSQTDKELPTQFVDLLKRLEKAEKRKS